VAASRGTAYAGDEDPYKKPRAEDADEDLDEDLDE
jgi:ribosome-binding factor A